MLETVLYEIALLEASLAIHHYCFACGDNIVPEDVFVVSIALKRQEIFYIHDQECFDYLVAGFNQFDAMRSKMRREDKFN